MSSHKATSGQIGGVETVVYEHKLFGETILVLKWWWECALCASVDEDHPPACTPALRSYRIAWKPLAIEFDLFTPPAQRLEMIEDVREELLHNQQFRDKVSRTLDRKRNLGRGGIVPPEAAPH